MSTKKKIVTSTTLRTAPTAQRAKTPSFTPKHTELIFGRTNYFLMLIGLALIGLGLVTMSGGAMPDPNTWDESLIYNSRRIVVGPLIIVVGLVVEVVAIFKNAGQTNETAEETA
jgi:uncharacterized membrane protein